MTYQAWHIPLFGLLAQHFEENHTDWFIRWLYSDGIALSVDNHEQMTTEQCFIPVETLTDDFLREARALWRSIPKPKEVT